MLVGLFILIAAVAIFLVLQWSAKNDSVSDKGKTTGLFAMKDPEEGPSDGEEEPGSDSRKRSDDKGP